MDSVVASTASILAIAATAWVVGRATGMRLCPICAGVGGTWLWMVVARHFGVAPDPTVLPILLGGSVAGTAALLEKRLPRGRSALAWKTSAIPVGFVAAYGLAAPDWSLFAAGLGAALVVGAVFFRPTSGGAADAAAVSDLERRLKDCC